ncbi:MAG: hypothetical protein H0V57_00125 [Thermoleophilaceae bacterium]|nr:hypothetical protein [Thermoleophilaceae bacterium]
MSYITARIEVPDYDTFKERWDSDPVGRRQAAIGHRLCRSVDNPNEVTVQVEFSSAAEAKSFRERLHTSGSMSNLKVLAPPVIVEEEETVAY